MPLDYINKLAPIPLEKTNSVKLMNRIDSKHLANVEMLRKVLGDIKEDYWVLEIDKERVLPYESLYYDTMDNNMFLAHHNGKLNRFKIRFRKYLTTNQVYLEIKYKHKGIRTIKERIEVQNLERDLSQGSMQFIRENCPYNPHKLEPKIYTNFSRITLVNKDFSERATIDMDLCFKKGQGKEAHLRNVVIIETKRDGNTLETPLKRALNKYGIHPSGLSKYCIGRTLLRKTLKTNRFKEKIITLNKIENGKHYFRGNIHAAIG